MNFTGTKVIKHHLKEKDATAALKKKAMSYVKTDNLPELPEDVDLGASFDAFIKECSKSVEDLMYMHTSGTKVIMVGLRHLPDEKLDALTNIFTFGPGHRGSSEERIVTAINLTFPLLSKFEAAKALIDVKSVEMVKKLIGLYVDEYSQFSGGTAKFNHVKLLDEIKEEKSRRKFSKAPARREQAAVSDVADDDEEAKRCIIA